VLFDETGFSFLAPLGRTWAPRGHRPILRRVTKERRVLSTAIGLTVSGKIFKRHFERAMRGDEVIVALEHLRRHIPGNWILVWDRAPIHKRVKVAEYLEQHPGILVEWLPPYAPEINPEEYCHGNVKQHLKNAAPQNRTEMRQMVNRGFARLRHRRDLIWGFFQHAGLVVNQLW
jgi:transposase